MSTRIGTRPGILLLLTACLLLGGCINKLVSTVGAAPISCLTACGGSGAESAEALRMLTFNVYHDFPDYTRLSERLELLAEHVIESGSDIVLLQELPWTSDTGPAIEYLAERTGMNYVYARANGNFKVIRFEEGVGILSRYPLGATEIHAVRPKPGYFANSVALAAVAHTPFGDIQVISAHLARGSEALSRDQVADFRRFVAGRGDYPTAIGADLNAREYWPHIEALSRDWTDAFRAANPTAPGLSCCIRKEQQRSRDAAFFARVDYLYLVSRAAQGWRVTQAERVFSEPFGTPEGLLWVSNHAGVAVRAELAAGTQTAQATVPHAPPVDGPDG
ncbi:MAG: hypothetical protein HKO62_12570 [Gammaproteobacteria bacterium]|nr:hypothetical protein [Gammaproteobacteria bacterium]